jgi:hypothetical protein
MRKTRTTMLAVFLLCAAVDSALAREAWNWTLPYVVRDYTSPADSATDSTGKYFYLTDNNGSHAVAMTKYADDDSVWTSILTQRWNPTWDEDNDRHIGYVRALEYKGIGTDWRHWVTSDVWPFVPAEPGDEEKRAVNCHVANNALYKTYSWGNINLLDPEDGPDGYGINPPDGDVPNLGYQGDDFWFTQHPFSEGDRDSLVNEMGVAIALFRGPDSSARMHGCAVWVADNFGWMELRRAYTLDGGSTWAVGGTHFIMRDDDDPMWSHPSLATDDVNGSNTYLAYDGCQRWSCRIQEVDRLGR